MALGFGYNAYVSWGEEGTYGTAVAGAKSAEIESESIKGSRTLTPLKTLGSLSNKRTTKTKTTVSGGFKMPFIYAGHEQWLKHAFGSGSVGTTGANPYTHTFTLKAALLTGLTVLVNRDATAIGGSSMFQYTGCHVNKLTLSQEIEQPLMLEVDLIGSGFGVAALQAATYPSTYVPLDYGQVTVANLDASGAPYAMLLQKFKLEIDNKLEPRHRLTGPASFGANRTDHRQVSFEADIEFDSLTAYNQFLNASTEDYQFKWMLNSGDATVNTLQIDIPKAYVTEIEPETSGPGPYVMSLKASALMNAADNDELSIVLKNTTVGPI